jgi:hypothetical protein
MKRGYGAWGLVLGVVVTLGPAACGGQGEAVTGTGGFDGGVGGTAGGAASGGDAGTGGSVILPDASGGVGGTSPTDAGPRCGDITCERQQRCEERDGGAVCVPADCGSLRCSDTEVCLAVDGGAYCNDNTCGGDVECPSNQYCATGQCQPDTCAPGERRCQGQALLECAPNGGSEITRFTCGSGSPYFTSTCSTDASGAGCPCEDDWDCPANTECDAGTCRGTGRAPTCRLPPEPFTNVLPRNEISWGGTATNVNARNAPFPASAQVVLTPVVANLDDDNGDGRVDERDFPEIIFTTFCDSSLSSDGMLRAIHGGGPNKGRDYFATCGTTHWKEGDSLTASCACSAADLDSTAGVAAGDLDGDGRPEIVAVTDANELRIYDNTGRPISKSAALSIAGGNPSPALANLDNAGLAEIVIGRLVVTLEKTSAGVIQVQDVFAGNQANGTNGQGPIACVANLVGDSKQEIVAGTTVYRLPQPPPGVTRRSQCTGSPTGEAQTFCNGGLVVVWDGQTVNGATNLPNTLREGFCAVADVLGANETAAPSPTNPLDQKPEVIIVSNNALLVLNGTTGTLRRNIDLGGTSLGGPPNVDDFDGDGFPEIGTAGSTAYQIVELQPATAACPAWPAATDNQSNRPRTPPANTCASDADCGNTAQFACNESAGRCVCLHNAWRRATEDDSSRVTGSSVFDFNGDGAAEVIYNDECRFRVYDGTTGAELFNEPSESRTRTEYPVVADVDNDGNAEIVFATSNESGFCSENLDSQYNNGLEVWGDANDLWVSARRVWNQHAYHVTNVTESVSLPRFEPESWKPYNGRIYNTYRSNPRSFGVAPDLIVRGVQLSAPGSGCATLAGELDITVEIANVGDLRVGPGVVVSFEGTWITPALTAPLGAGGGQPLRATLTQSLEPGDSVLITVRYSAANNAPGTLPARVKATVDDGDLERECIENNNSLEREVVGAAALPDLRVSIATPRDCPTPRVATTVRNDGNAPASNILVRYYLGDPQAGGVPFHEERIAGPLAPGASVNLDPVLTAFPRGVDVLVWAVVDPDGTIAECNDGNNRDPADGRFRCDDVPN